MLWIQAVKSPSIYCVKCSYTHIQLNSCLCLSKVSPRSLSQLTLVSAHQRSDSRRETNGVCLLSYRDLLQGNNTRGACLDAEDLPLCSLRHCSLQGESKSVIGETVLCSQLFEKGNINLLLKAVLNWLIQAGFHYNK